MLLAIYLDDHLAGATGMLELVRRSQLERNRARAALEAFS